MTVNLLQESLHESDMKQNKLKIYHFIRTNHGEPCQENKNYCYEMKLSFKRKIFEKKIEFKHKLCQRKDKDSREKKREAIRFNYERALA